MYSYEDPPDTRQFFQRMLTAHKQGAMMTCSFGRAEDEEPDNGLETHHAYLIIYVAEVLSHRNAENF